MQAMHHRAVSRSFLELAMLGLLGVQILGMSLAEASGEVTFAKDVAPILQRSCQSCHRPGSLAPMSLLTYADARPWARAMKQKTAMREMPPWGIEKNVGIQHFKDDISLTDEEIATFGAWADTGGGGLVAVRRTSRHPLSGQTPRNGRLGPRTSWCRPR